jgi:hypothetical protein
VAGQFFADITWANILEYRIDVQAHLLILSKKSPLHGLILVCTFIDFEKKNPPARLFHPARVLVLVLHINQFGEKKSLLHILFWSARLIFD